MTDETTPEAVSEYGIIRKLLIDNAAGERLTVLQLSEKTGASSASLYRVQNRLRKEGILAEPMGFAGKRSKRGPKPYRSTLVATVGDVEKLAASPTLSKEERVRALSEIAQLATDSVRISAIKALEDIERGTGTHIGPPIPLDEQGQVERLSRLMQAVGPQVTEKARQRAFSASKEASGELPQEAGKGN